MAFIRVAPQHGGPVPLIAEIPDDCRVEVWSSVGGKLLGVATVGTGASSPIPQGAA